MLVGGRIGLHKIPTSLTEHIYEAVATVRVLQRVNDDDQVLQQLPGFVPLIGQQVIRSNQRRITWRNFISVHGVRQPDNCRCRFDNRFRLFCVRLVSIGQGEIVLANLV